jgi:uncharacterized OB-fold protein
MDFRDLAITGRVLKCASCGSSFFTRSGRRRKYCHKCGLHNEEQRRWYAAKKKARINDEIIQGQAVGL